MNYITSNADYTVRFALVDSAGNVIDPTSTDVEDIEIVVYQRKNVILQSFILSDSSITIYDAPNGLVDVNLDRANMQRVKGRIYGELILTIDDAGFSDTHKKIKVTDILIAEVKESVC